MDNTKTLTSLALDAQYRTGSNDPINAFYRPCLERSTRYDRAVGYFRSSVYLIVGNAIVSFARGGGKIRLVCSPSLTDEDQAGIALGYEMKEKHAEVSLLSEIEGLLSNPETSYRTRILATLIASGNLEIKIAIRSDAAAGIYHEKIGVFHDSGGNLVSFLGSSNETWNAWHFRGNHESIEVFCSWSSASDASRATRHCAYFEDLWEDRVNGLSLVGFPAAAKAKLLQASLVDLEGVDIDPAPEQSKRQPLPHQEAALTAWEENGCRGVFEHATGSGKTFLAITAIARHANSGYPSLVLVPSALLLKQWTSEILSEIPEATILLAGAGHASWERGMRLKSMTHPEATPDKRIVVATMQTAATSRFVQSVSDGSTLLIVADEVHQIGSPFNSRAMTINASSRMGLSATPVRYGDPEGTQNIFNYFGNVLEPRVSLKDAIDTGRLVPYQYYPHPVHLTAGESENWRDITRRITLEIARSTSSTEGQANLTEKAKLLLIQRSRIAKKAEHKVSLAVDVLTTNYEPGQRWLIYCEDQEQLSQVVLALGASGIQAVEYHTSMAGDQTAALHWFRSVGGVLAAIKCLDEGVDIPAADHALILASSQNPRQFIQRRGRVLRKAPNKHIAVIHDAIVVPVSIEDEPSQVALLRSELVRAIEFARAALNLSAAAELRAIALELGIDADDTTNIGLEEDEP